MIQRFTSRPLTTVYHGIHSYAPADLTLLYEALYLKTVYPVMHSHAFTSLRYARAILARLAYAQSSSYAPAAPYAGFHIKTVYITRYAF